MAQLKDLLVSGQVRIIGDLLGSSISATTAIIDNLSASNISVTTAIINNLSVTGISFGTTKTFGNSAKPIYWNAGVPQAITNLNIQSLTATGTATIVNLNVTNTTTLVNVNTSNINVKANSGITFDSTSSIGSTSKPIYWNNGIPAEITSMSISGNITASNKIDGVTLSGDITHYGVCSTASDTGTKTVACTGFSATTGANITVKFKYSNTYSTPSGLKLNVASTGAKNIYYNGTYIPVNLLSANAVYQFVYNGAQYELIGGVGGTNVKVFANNATSTVSYYIIGQAGTTESSSDLYKAKGTSASGANSAGIYFTPVDQVLMGAAWNDYAEFRQTKENIEPGRVVKENGDGTLSLTTMRLEKGCEIVSDTYGFGIGKSDIATLPIASSGRVLAYPDKEPSLFTIGAPVCSGPNGTVSEMTEEEEAKYPSRIIGTVSEIPDYEIWHGANDVEVNGRIWIRIR